MPWQDLLNKMVQNVNGSGQLAKDSGDIMWDRALMKARPNVQGPPLPEQMMPQEKAYMDSMAGGMMGSIAPAGKAIVKSAPWMKGLTQEVVDAAVPVGKGLANSAENTIYTQAADAARKFQELKRKLRGY